MGLGAFRVKGLGFRVEDYRKGPKDPKIRYPVFG